MTTQEKLDKVNNTLSSSATPKELIPDLKKKKADLEVALANEKVELAQKAEYRARGKAAVKQARLDKEAADIALKKARVRRQMISGKLVKKKAKRQIKRASGPVPKVRISKATKRGKKRANTFNVPKYVKRFNSQRSRGDLKRDAQRHAMAPGKHRQKRGSKHKFYYEKRANRTDVSPKWRLDKGGSLGDSPIDQIARGYMSAILFTEVDWKENPLEDNYSINSFSDKSVADILDMIGKYVSENKSTIDKSGLDLDQIGIDIWFAQSGQGAGFFDRNLDKDVEKQLTESAKRLGKSVFVEVGDDGKIYVYGIGTMADGGLFGSRSKSGLNKDRKYFNKREKHEVDYARATGRKKISYRAKGGSMYNAGGDIGEKREFRYLIFEPLKYGLKISLTEEGKEEAKDIKLNEHNFYDLFDDVQGNSEYVFVSNGGDAGFGLTEAPMILDGYYQGEDGNGYTTDYPESAKAYYYNDYMITDFAEVLADNGEVSFRAVESKQEGGRSNLRAVKVTYANGDTVVTDMAAHLTDDEIRKYFAIGKEFNMGYGGKDNMQKVTKVEILKEKGGSLYDGGGDVDSQREIQLYAENDGDLYRQSLTPIRKNLIKKLAQGKYDHAKAAKLFVYYVEAADKKYQKEFGVAPSGYILSVADRKELSRSLEENFYAQAKAGEYDEYIPLKYREKGITYVTESGELKHEKGKPFPYAKYPVGTRVIINTGGKDIEGIVSDKEGKSTHGSYWKEQDSYLIKFDNGTSQYLPASSIVKSFAKGGKPSFKKNEYTETFKEVQDSGDTQYYIRSFGTVEPSNGKKINLVVIAEIQDLEGAISEEEIKEHGGQYALRLSLLPEEKFISKKIKDTANDDDNSIGGNTIVNVQNYMGGLNYQPNKKYAFNSAEDALKYLHSKELNDLITVNGHLSGFVMDAAYNRAGNDNWSVLDYIIGEKDRMFAKGGYAKGGKPSFKKEGLTNNVEVFKAKQYGVVKTFLVYTDNGIDSGRRGIESGYGIPKKDIVWEKSYKADGFLMPHIEVRSMDTSMSKGGKPSFKKKDKSCGCEMKSGGNLGGKIKLKNIVIHWAEGDNSKYPKFPKTYETWGSANEAIIPIFNDSEKHGGGGYNKVKFTVTFEDGDTYDGRLDVSKGEDNPTITDNVFGKHINDYLHYLISDRSTESEASKKEISEWLEKYDLGMNKRIVTSSKERDASMLKILKSGEGIKNQYAGKTAKEVWTLWTDKQRSHFLADHFSNEDGPSSSGKTFVAEVEMLLPYEELATVIQNELRNHIHEGEYKTGGPVYNKGGKANSPKYKVGQAVYSYQNPTEPFEISMVRLSDDPTYAHKYKIGLRNKEGYSHSSKWISEGSISTTPLPKPNYAFVGIHGNDAFVKVNGEIVKKYTGKNKEETLAFAKQLEREYNLTGNNPSSDKGGVGSFEYKTVNTRTENGLKEAEKLKEQGWKIISSGTDTIQFERRKKPNFRKGGKVHPEKVGKVMREFKAHKLKSHGKVVTDRKTAIAIALSEANLSKPK